MNNQSNTVTVKRRRRALKAAFPYTIPILTGFLFLGIAYGIYMSTSGFFFLYPTLMAMLIFGGSLEFIAVSMLLSPFAPLSAFVIAFMIQCRHLFYGIAMLDQYKGMGWKKFFLIFGLCDETFSLNYTAEIPEDVDRGWFMLGVTWFNQLYWITGSTIGALAGSMIHFSTDGLSFVMTSMFVVIFLEQWRKEKVRLSAAVGFGASVVCLLLFGADSFMVPSVVSILILLTILRRPMERKYRYYEELEDQACESAADKPADPAAASPENRITDAPAVRLDDENTAITNGIPAVDNSASADASPTDNKNFNLDADGASAADTNNDATADASNTPEGREHK